MRAPLLFIFILGFGLFGRAQDCTQTADNILCAEGQPVADSMITNPVAFDCFNSILTYYSTFHTGSLAGGFATLNILPGDCDDFTGPNDLTVIVAQLPAGADPCDPTTYTNISPCQSSNVEFDYTVTNLEPDADYVVVLGTEHDPIYGPCEFELTISGTAVDISTTTEPFLVYLGGSSQLEAFNATSYTWTPPDYLSDPNIPNPVSTPEVTTTYQVSGTIGTCEVTGEATVTVGPPIIIYDAFTPNGDNINDEWTILGMERFESSLVTVYDRWGQQIFKSTGYAKPWDGTNKGKSLPMGAYYYVIELNSLEVNIPPVTGVISIIK
jgi:gliding motility-associated-like protein